MVYSEYKFGIRKDILTMALSNVPSRPNNGSTSANDLKEKWKTLFLNEDQKVELVIELFLIIGLDSDSPSRFFRPDTRVVTVPVSWISLTVKSQSCYR